MNLRCYHEDCGREWDYKGKATVYATCPSCMRKIKISKALVES